MRRCTGVNVGSDECAISDQLVRTDLADFGASDIATAGLVLRFSTNHSFFTVLISVVLAPHAICNFNFKMIYLLRKLRRL